MSAAELLQALIEVLTKSITQQVIGQMGSDIQKLINEVVETEVNNRLSGPLLKEIVDGALSEKLSNDTFTDEIKELIDGKLSDYNPLSEMDSREFEQEVREVLSNLNLTLKVH